MEIARLTDVAVKQAKPRDREYRLSDGGWLYLAVTPSGGKLWRWSFQFNGREKLLSYGRYPSIKIAIVRELHREARDLLASGIDPCAAKQDRKKAEKEAARDKTQLTFSQVAKEWLKTWGSEQSAKYVQTVGFRLDGEILKAIGDKPIQEIKAIDVVKMAKGISKRGAVDLAKRALQKTKQILRFAVANDYIPASPAEHLRPRDFLSSTKVKNFARIESQELPQLLKDIELYRGSQQTRLAMKLMALTFLRTTEMIGAEWKEFDFEGRRWMVPKNRMKGKKAPHIVPLADQTIELLNLLRQLSGDSRYLFPGQGTKNPIMSNNTILKALDRMGYKGRMTGHGFRGVASTILHESGCYKSEHIEVQLAHLTFNKVAKAYNYAEYLEPRTKMMQDWADFLERTLRTEKYILMKPNG